MVEVNLNKREYYINRELSWLEFNYRVLQEAKNSKNPLLERLKFLSIVSSNLDEFFMIRVASLKNQVLAGYNKLDPSGLSPKKQLNAISLETHKMISQQYQLFNNSIVPSLKKQSIFLLSKDDLHKDEILFLEDYFKNVVYPVLTPMAVDSSRPFPLILNKSLNIAVLIEDKSAEGEFVFATVQVPSLLPRFKELPCSKGHSKRFILLEEIITLFIEELFLGHPVVCSFPYRITRDTDLTIEEEDAEDLLVEIERSLRNRRRGSAIRLEIHKSIDTRLIHILKTALEIHEGEIYYIDGPLDLTFLLKIYNLEGYDFLKYPHHTPQIPKDLIDSDDILDAIAKKDILLHHPYESFDPVIDFVKKASIDPQVLAIKQTLYRVSGDSPIVQALIEAAERGKQVTVLLEVKARFDEENNIQWAKKLEKAGCHVIYGLVGLKTHCKITLVVRIEENRIKRYVHLGTGNYNDITAKFYTDIGLFTCKETFGADVSAIFNMLSGYSDPPDLYKLEVAPLNLRGKFMELIKAEIQHAQQGKKAKIIAKMNSLVDIDIIKALYRASIAGVKVDLIIRGICCLKPGIPHISENIRVISIVGRFLEHSRIYYFHNDGSEDIYLSSSDWMPRNLDRRIETLFPIEDIIAKERIIELLEISLLDTVKANRLNSEGKYLKIDKRGKKTLDSQIFFYKLAMKEVKKHKNQNSNPVFEPVTSNDSINAVENIIIEPKTS
ncbi:RNA degradosome polyphosphate kinase [Serpentinicella alkaliphila]|uniref:Polyphosphate kinase n=1 Tax=Serpentinicella alkaliphila TaxID=1734049 RepID=A0A4R2T334_9FIRM|nr:RNA degradosome polyphosphate kinase [Serpentinicella alkaliphila]QUH25798.1 RNA degradosome polyphosphate kinase [Serpentinicella alkaliphila]TCP95841.1 polyphosphate kinase [Serpentinicella alkaliphila]